MRRALFASLSATLATAGVMATWSDVDFGVALSFPAEWRVAESPADPEGPTLLAVERGGKRGLLLLVSRDVVRIDSLSARAIGALGGSFRAERDEDVAMIGGVPARGYAVDGRFPDDADGSLRGRVVEGRLLVASNGERGCVLLVYAEKPTREEDVALFDAVCASVHFVEDGQGE